jgi:hypothetical protein
MLPAQPSEDMPRRLGSASSRVRQSLLNPLDGLDSVEQRLVGPGILNHQLCLAVDRQHKGMSGLAEAVQEVDRVALEVTERTMSLARSSMQASSNVHRI